MIYDYVCSGCSGVFEIAKPVIRYDADEFCPTSGTLMSRIFKPKIYLSGTKVEDARYSPALGHVVKSTQEERRLAKERGMVEVGNEKPEKHIKWTPKDYE